jgi:hypothetical protein
MGGRLPTYLLMTRKSAMIAAWFVVIDYRLHMRSGRLLVLAAADAIGLVQKELSVT